MSALTAEEIAFLDRILDLIRDPSVDMAGERGILAAALASSEARGALRKQHQVDRMSADMARVLGAVQEAANHDQLAAAFVQVANQGPITGEMVANLITQLVRTRAELIDLLQAQHAQGKGPTMVFGHMPASPKAMEEAFQSFASLRDGSGERAAFQMAVAQLLQSEPEHPASPSAS